MLTELFLVVFLVLCTIQLHLKNTRSAKILEKVPGPPIWPVIGNLPSLLGSPAKVWTTYRNWAEKYKKVFVFWTMSIPLVHIADAENAEILLSNTQNLEKDYVYDFLIPWLGSGLLISDGEIWRPRRKILTPAFHFHILRKYFNTIVENGEKTIQSLKSDESVVSDLMTVVKLHTLNVICEAAMGTSLEGKSYDLISYKEAVHDMGESLAYRMFRPWLKPEWIYNLTPKGKKQIKTVKILHDFTNKMIQERKEYHEKTNGKYLNEFGPDEDLTKESNDEEIMGNKKKRLAMLDLLIAANKNNEQIDNDTIREEVDTFSFAGHDTTAVSLFFTLLLIAEHKDVQTQIREEVNEILNNSGDKLGFAEVQQMNYLERCLKESLRLYPSVPHIMRKLNEDLQLKEYLIPKGTSITVHIMQVHRNSEHWPDPLKFDPDRFLPGRSKGRHPYAYIPFSAGPRNCIGQKFAMTELKCIIAQIVRNFYLEPIDLAHEIELQLDMVLRPTRPIKLKFIPVNK